MSIVLLQSMRVKYEPVQILLRGADIFRRIREIFKKEHFFVERALPAKTNIKNPDF